MASIMRRLREDIRLRHAADLRSLLWLAMAAVVASASWCLPDARAYLLPAGAYFSLASGLIAHGHNHCPAFRNRGMNQLVNLATTAFFGFPTFVWLAGHNKLHHKYTNAPGDPSATWRLSNRHNLLTAVVCPLYAIVCEPLLIPFLVESWRTNRRRFRACMLQIAFYVGLIVIGVTSDWRAFVWAFALPWLLGLYLVHYFNYIQHVHCDPYSDFAHSRDWTGRLLNSLLFNQGYHTVHHNHPGIHWSRWPALHERVRDRIPAELQSDNLATWLIRQYLLAPFSARYGTRQIGSAPWERAGREPRTVHIQPESGDSF